MSRPAFIGVANLTEWGLVLGISQQAMSWRVRNMSPDRVLTPRHAHRCSVCGRRGHNKRRCGGAT